MTHANQAPLIVAVGASAGGLEAFRELITAIGDSPEFAIVFVQHHDPASHSLLAELLRQQTTLPVQEVKTRSHIQTNMVYLCPPQVALELDEQMLVPIDRVSDERERNVIDHFFHSVAHSQGQRGIGVILSGAGSDGTLGLKSISDNGGTTFAQDADSAKFDSMPRNAATTGVADHVMTPAQIAKELLKYAQYMSEIETQQQSVPILACIEHSIPEIADQLLQETGHNFKHYKTNTLARRIHRRMQVLKLSKVPEYVDRMKTDTEESHQLFRELLIGVTAFFRDPESFDELARDILPRIFHNRRPDDTVRIWVPGCATGEEAYSLAILCREYVQTNDAPTPAFQIFASDIDERALDSAREGSYPIGIADNISGQRLDQFFIKRGRRYCVSKEIRESVLFSSHNLISDPPFSRLDLISCRNLLIYLGPHLQKKLIPLFHYALRPNGFLFLGPSESMSSHGELFRTLNAKHRISQRKGTAIGGTAPIAARGNWSGGMRSYGLAPMENDKSDMVHVMQRIILDEFSPKSVVVDEDGQVICSSGETNKYLSTGEGPFQNNIVKMARPGLRIGLRAALNEAKFKRRRVTHENLSVPTDDGKQRVMLTVQPMMRMGEDSGLFLVVFHDIGLPIEIGENGFSSDQQLLTSVGIDRHAAEIIEQLERELSSTRDDLERTMQEMETANEELKSSNEELLSMNEELQSANEELQTSKEEIRASSDAVARANADLENLLRSIRIATIFLDDDLSIRSFTPAATQIYGLIPTDIGRPLTQIVPDVESMPPLPQRSEIEQAKEIKHTVTTRSGSTYIRRVLPYETYTGQQDGMVVTFTDVSQLKDSKELFQLLVEASAQIVWITNAEGFVTEDSPSWRAFTGQSYDDWIGHGWLDAVHPEDREPTMTQWLSVVATGGALSKEYRLRHHSGNYRWTHVRAVAQRYPSGEVNRWVGMNVDIHDRKVAERELADAKARLELSLEVSDVAPWSWDTSKNDVITNPILNRLFGFAEDECPGMPEFIERMEPDCRDRVSAAINHSMQTGETYDQEYPIRWPTGEVRHVRARGNIRLSHDGSLEEFAGVIIDVTERKRRELDLAEREAHLRRVINNQLGLVGVIDRDGRLLEVDDRSLEIARSRREEVIGKPFAEAPWWTYDPAVVDKIRDAMHRAYTGDVVRFDVSLFEHGENGVLIDFMIAPVFDNDGKVEFLIPSGVDIRERHASEQSLKETSRRMKMALRAGGMAAWEWTPQKSFWGKELYALLGINPSQTASSELFFSLVHPDDLETLKTNWQSAVDGDNSYDCEFRVIRSDGQIRWIKGLGEVVRDKAGKVIRMYGVNWDATREHDHEAALRESERRAQAANSSKSEFLANMSHEIRTPMTAILGYAELLKDFVHDDEARDHLATIRRNGDYLLEIINDILDLSKIEANKFDIERERFDPIRLIEDVRSIMVVRARESGLELIVDYQGKVPRVIESDAKRLKQILINLVGNAIKFTREGRVNIRVRFEPGQERLHFDVVDTGIGMSTQQIDRLFKPFSQGDSSVTRHFGGTGLGLAISNRLAEMLGGKILVSSTEEVGSTFTVSIKTGEVEADLLVANPDSINPSNVAVSDLAGSKVAIGEPSDPPALSCRVLVVDDRRDIRFLSRHILSRAGAIVDECEDGQLAVEHIADRIGTEELPQVVMLDMQMPNLDGYQTARRLRELGYTQPIIALTADAMQGDMTKCLEAGCNDYLSKPIDANRMLQLVRKLTQHYAK